MSNDNTKLPPNKATYDPGWNDPPMFSYDTTPPSATGKSKRNLNKRVAFPLQSPGTETSASKIPLSSSGLPMPFSTSITTQPTNFDVPPTNVANILPPPSNTIQPVLVKQDTAINSSNETKSCERQSYIISTLDRTVNLLSRRQNTNEFKEIIKRIEILKTSYEILDPKIQTILYKISNSIESKNIVEATKLHRILAVDYLNVCSQWAPALRQLILLAGPNEITEQEIDHKIPFYSKSSTDTMSRGASNMPDSQLEDDRQKSTTKHNFAKIYHI